MKWFEPIIAIIAIGLVILPIILRIIRKKNNKGTCSSNCCCCDKRDTCLSNFKQYIEQNTKQN